MIKHFVVLGTQTEGNVAPALERGGYLVLFDSRVAANAYAEKTFAGHNWGFTVYTTEVPG